MTSTPIVEQLGQFIPDLVNSKEYLTIHFSPNAPVRQERWRNYGLSADFLGDYFANFFPGKEADNVSKGASTDRSTIRSTISFIANELLENAIKYQMPTVQEPISISLFLHGDYIVFKSTNFVDSDQALAFKGFIQRILNTQDINRLFTQQLEMAATGTGESNMGLLTMICDYQVEFGWRFQPLSEQPQIWQIDVLAHLNLKTAFLP